MSSIIIGSLFLFCTIYIIIELVSEFKSLKYSIIIKLDGPDYNKVTILILELVVIPVFLIAGIIVVGSKAKNSNKFCVTPLIFAGK